MTTQQKLTAAGKNDFYRWAAIISKRHQLSAIRLASKIHLADLLQSLTKVKPTVSYSEYPKVDVKGDTDFLRTLAAQLQQRLQQTDGYGFQFKVESPTSTIGVSKRVKGFSSLECYIVLYSSQNFLSVTFNE